MSARIVRILLLPFFVSAAIACGAIASHAQTAPAPESAPDPEASSDVAMVRLDGRDLFAVYGVSTHPAGQRARDISARIARAAADPAVSPDSLTLTEVELGAQIMARDYLMCIVTVADARLERLSVPQAAAIRRLQIAQAIRAHRDARSPDRMLGAAIRTAVASAILVALLLALTWIRRRVRGTVQRYVRDRVRAVKIQSLEILRPESIWSFVDGSLRALGVVALLVLVFLYLDYVLGLWPWTRAIAGGMLGYVLDPLRTMGTAFVGYLPNLVFIAVLALVCRFVLGILQLIATSLERGVIQLDSFHAEWAVPTFGLVRIGIVALALVIAFPYIPGSSSPAFQGVSIFVGVLISLGSSSLMGNVVAGYSLIYWRALRIGDRVQIGDVRGEVIELRRMVTHLRTPKNEEVVLPNSLVLSGKIINFSSLARERGLILHTTVGVGYEVPWRQVEAMLVIAARRTQNVLSDPPPFVLQRDLGAFAVQYELNAYTDTPPLMLRTYSELHSHILDVFNEHGVQIMTPAYEGDPSERKVVAKENWNPAPAGQVRPAPPAPPASPNPPD